MLATHRESARNLTVEGYLRDVVQILSGVGYKDTHLDDLVNIKFCLNRKLRTYNQANPPPLDHVRPTPISHLQECWKHL